MFYDDVQDGWNGMVPVKSFKRRSQYLVQPIVSYENTEFWFLLLILGLVNQELSDAEM